MKKKLNTVMIMLFIGIIVIASDRGTDKIDVIGCTELNGDGCVCHSFEKDTNVAVWVEGPDTLVVGQTGSYKMFLTGGPAEAGGYNVAGRFGTMEIVDTLSFRHPLEVNELTQSFPLLFPSSSDTVISSLLLISWSLRSMMLLVNFSCLSSPMPIALLSDRFRRSIAGSSASA